jgi:phytoene dehydrogenase-like protein
MKDTAAPSTPRASNRIWDAVVVGAGHNGLVTASYLARSGLDVLVVEKNDWIGGAAVSRELYPGFTYSNCSYVCSLFRPEIMRDLDLPAHGLQVLPYEGGAVFQRDGGYLATYRDHEANRREIRPPLAARRRGLRPLCARPDAPLPLHPPASDAHPAGPGLVQAARSVGNGLSGSPVPGARRG